MNAQKFRKIALLTLLTENDGKVCPKKIESNITKKTKLVSIMFANNELGSINDIYKISKLTKKHNIQHVDAVQCVGKIPIDLNDLNIDLMTFLPINFMDQKVLEHFLLEKVSI